MFLGYLSRELQGVQFNYCISTYVKNLMDPTYRKSGFESDNHYSVGAIWLDQQRNEDFFRKLKLH